MKKMVSPKTKIVCTIGPASESPEVMKPMMEAGMNVARLNFSHGEFAAHKRVIENLRAASASIGLRIAIMADLSGPKMRIGKFASEPVDLETGDQFTLTADDVEGDKRRVSVSFARLPQSVKPGDTLFLNDGYIQLEVNRVAGNDVICVVKVGGELRSRKGLNLPGIDLGISAFTERDHECLKFALENGVDAVSQSFVERASDIEAVRKAASDLGYDPFIIAKIERSGALDHIDEIIAAADGIMIARGDLGVEVPIEKIAIVQKRLMHLANRSAKPVITATQMLESMIDNRRPTRAEATDVANAILDGTDCVMLSAESAMGRYPVDAVAMLARIAVSAEAQRPVKSVQELYKGIDLKGLVRPGHLIAIGVEACLEYVTPAAVFVPTKSGATARGIARFRLPAWTVAVSAHEATCRHLQFSSGVYPVCESPLPGDWTDYVRKQVASFGFEGNLAMLTEGPSPDHPEMNHRLEIIEIPSRMGYVGEGTGNGGASNRTIRRERFDAVLFDLDGVLTDTASVHAACWKKMFDAFLQKHAEEKNIPFQPFDVGEDYRRYVDGKLRYDGVKSFLDARGIGLHFGDVDEPPGFESIAALGNLKDRMVQDVLETEGVRVYGDSVVFLRRLREAGFKTAVVSASRNAGPVLQVAGIADLFDARIDGVVADSRHLAGKPAPDTFLEAARQLGCEPMRAVVVEDAVSGVRAGREGRFGLVVAVARAGNRDILKEGGADVVVDDLSELK